MVPSFAPAGFSDCTPAPRRVVAHHDCIRGTHVTERVLEPAYASFSDAVEAVLAHIHQRLGSTLTMFTRVDGERWRLLHVLDYGYGVEPGTELRWDDSICSQMVQGLGPRIAPAVATIPAYADQPIRRALPIGTYAAVPLTRPDGTLFGTLCAISPRENLPEITDDLAMLEMNARLLGRLIDAELSAGALRRANRLFSAPREVSGAVSAEVWTEALGTEDAEVRGLGSRAEIVSVSLHTAPTGAQAADVTAALRAGLPPDALVARPTDTEFAALVVDGSAGTEPVASLRRLLDALAVRSDVTIVRPEPGEELAACWLRARGGGPDDERTHDRGAA